MIQIYKDKISALILVNRPLLFPIMLFISLLVLFAFYLFLDNDNEYHKMLKKDIDLVVKSNIGHFEEDVNLSDGTITNNLRSILEKIISLDRGIKLCLEYIKITYDKESSNLKDIYVLCDSSTNLESNKYVSKRTELYIKVKQRKIAVFKYSFYVSHTLGFYMIRQMMVLIIFSLAIVICTSFFNVKSDGCLNVADS